MLLLFSWCSLTFSDTPSGNASTSIPAFLLVLPRHHKFDSHFAEWIGIKIHLICNKYIFSNYLYFNDGFLSLPCPSVFVSFVALPPITFLNVSTPFLLNRDISAYFVFGFFVIKVFIFVFFYLPSLPFVRPHIRILCVIVHMLSAISTPFPRKIYSTIFWYFLGPLTLILHFFLLIIFHLSYSTCFHSNLACLPHIHFVLFHPFPLPNKTEQSFSGVAS